jgi:putative ABC transport system substrate-binding protein
MRSEANQLSSRKRREVLALAIGILVTGGARGAHAAAAAELRVVTGPDSPGTRQILESLRARYGTLAQGSDVDALARRPGPAIYLTLGPAALKDTLGAGIQAPVVSLFSSSQSFRLLLASTPSAAGHTTAIFAEASISAQCQLVAALYQRRVTAGVLVSKQTAQLDAAIAKAAKVSGLDVIVRERPTGASVLQEFSRLSSANVLLAVPDPGIWSSENLRDILESSYRRGQGVIGFTPSLVSAGALATAYASVDDVWDQLDQLIPELQAGRLPPPDYPTYWRVVINDTAARSLNLIVRDEVRTLGNQFQRSQR